MPSLRSLVFAIACCCCCLALRVSAVGSNNSLRHAVTRKLLGTRQGIQKIFKCDDASWEEGTQCYALPGDRNDGQCPDGTAAISYCRTGRGGIKHGNRYDRPGAHNECRLDGYAKGEDSYLLCSGVKIAHAGWRRVGDVCVVGSDSDGCPGGSVITGMNFFNAFGPRNPAEAGTCWIRYQCSKPKVDSRTGKSPMRVKNGNTKVDCAQWDKKMVSKECEGGRFLTRLVSAGHDERDVSCPTEAGGSAWIVSECAKVEQEGQLYKDYNGKWERVGSVQGERTITLEMSVARTEEKTTRTSISATLGVSADAKGTFPYGEVSVSTSYSRTVGSELSSLYSKTEQGTKKIEDKRKGYGQLWKWVLTADAYGSDEGLFAVGDYLITNSSAPPKCPPQFCPLSGDGNSFQDCSCCTSNAWVAKKDQHKVTVC